MKDFSLPRMILILWFLNYSLFSVVSYAFGGGRREISYFIVLAAVWMVVELICLGLIDDKL